MTTLRSALPVRMSYKVKVRSDPAEASTEDSEGLKWIDVTVSVDVEYVRFDSGLDLAVVFSEDSWDNGMPYFDSSQICTVFAAVANRGSVR